MINRKTIHNLKNHPNAVIPCWTRDLANQIPHQVRYDILECTLTSYKVKPPINVNYDCFFFRSGLVFEGFFFNKLFSFISIAALLARFSS